jgi:hypothetical protein
MPRHPGSPSRPGSAAPPSGRTRKPTPRPGIMDAAKPSRRPGRPFRAGPLACTGQRTASSGPASGGG